MNTHVTPASLLRAIALSSSNHYFLVFHKPQRWSLSWIYRQKAYETSFPVIRLPNGNLVKFSHTNRKHFTVGDPMAFPIVKMGDKPPSQTSPSLAQRGPPSNTAMPRPTARTTPNRSSDGWGTVAHVRHKVHIGYNGAPQIRHQKYPFLWTDHQNPLFASSLDQSDLTPNGIRIRYAVFPQCTGQTNRQTDRRTDRQIVHGKVWRLRPLRSESDAAIVYFRSWQSQLWTT